MQQLLVLSIPISIAFFASFFWFAYTSNKNIRYRLIIVWVVCAVLQGAISFPLFLTYWQSVLQGDIQFEEPVWLFIMLTFLGHCAGLLIGVFCLKYFLRYILFKPIVWLYKHGRQKFCKQR